MNFQNVLRSAPLLLSVLVGLSANAAGVDSTNDGTSRVQLADARWLSTGGASANARASDDATIDDASVAGGMLHARSGHSTTLMPDGRVLIWGGIGADGRIVEQGEWFDPRTQRFVPAGPIDLIPRTGHAAVLRVDGSLLMIGGRAEAVGALTRIEAWDRRRNRATVLDAVLTHAMLQPTAELQGDGSVRISESTSDDELVLDAQSLAASSLSTSATSALNQSVALTASSPAPNVEAVPLDAVIGLQFSAPVSSKYWNDAPASLIGPRGQEAVTLVPAEGGRLLFLTPRQELLPASRYTVVFGRASASLGDVAPGTIAFQTERVTPLRPDPRVSTEAGDAISSMLQAGIGAVSSSSTSAPPVALVGEGAQALRDRRVAARFTFTEPASTDPEFWVPTSVNLGGQWRTGRAISEASRAQIALGLSRNEREKAWRGKLFKSTSTALSGYIYSLADRPLAGVSVSIGAQTTQTDAAGRYQFSDVQAGKQQLIIDGRTAASNKDSSFGQFVIGVDLTEGRETPVTPVHLPKIRNQDWIDIESPLRSDITITTPLMPGFSVHLPKGTVLRDREGKIVRRVAIIPVPLDRTPINYPVNTPLHMSFQPAGLQVEGLTPGVTSGIRFVYPNYSGAEPGRVADFLNYDPLEKGWYTYGSGRVSADGLYVVPDAATEIYKATGFGISFGPDVPPVTPQTCGAEGGDPVDLRTGLFMHHTSGAALSDRLPVRIDTTYRPGDNVSRDFGKGVFHAYSHYLYKAGTSGHANWDEFWLVLPDCSKVRFHRTSPEHSSYPNVDYLAISDQLPGAWYGATLTYKIGSPGLAEYQVMEITRRDGMKLLFPLIGGQLLFIADRLGNKIELTRVGGALLRVTGPSGRYLDLATGTGTRVNTVTDMGGRAWQYTYDANARLTRITYPDASFERYVYDSSGRMQEVWDRRGNRMVLNGYDAQDRVIQQTLSDGGTHQLSYVTGSDGKISETTVTDPDGSVRRVRFHASGWPSEETAALGTALERTTYFERNALGFKQAVVDPLGRRTEFGYDSQQRLISTTVLAGTAQALTSSVAYNASHDPISSTDPEGRVTTYIWDARRRLQKVIDDRQRAVTYAYDSQDRVTSVTDPEQRMTTFSYQLHDLVKVTDTEGRTVKRYVDALGRTQSISDEQGRTAKLEYDALDRVTKQIAPDGSSTSFTYDPMGNLKSLTDAKLSITRWDYDSRQRPITHTDALNQVETWSYDEAAGTVTHTDRQLRQTVQSFDLLGRPIRETLGDAEIWMEYDIADRLVAINDESSLISFEYDALDNVTRETIRTGEIDYEYDAFGRLTGMTPSGQPATTYQYDVHDRLTRIRRNQGAESVLFTYDAQDRVTGITLPNGTQRTHTFSADGRLSRISYSRNGALIGDLNYVFDSSGQLIERTGSLAEDVLPAATTANASTDANHRLTSFDAAALVYDDSGNLIDDGTRQYRYDGRDRLIGIDENGTAITTFQYDVLGRRISKRDEQTHVETLYRYDGQNVIEEATGGAITTMLNGFGLDERYSRTSPRNIREGGAPIGEIIPEERSTFITDALGSTIGLQNSGGNWQARYRYTPYGQTQAQAFDVNGIAMPAGAAADTALARLNNPYQYTGRENDGDGLYYYRARYYSPQMGRFTQEDPLGFGGGDENFYAYVGGAPTMYNDPTGEIAFLPFLFWMAAGVAVDWAYDRWVAPGMEQFMLGYFDCETIGYFNNVGTLFSIVRTIKNPSRLITRHGHHPWPKYLGGPIKQNLKYLKTKLHYYYHEGLDFLYPRWRGKKFYDDLDPSARRRMIKDLKDYTDAFDSANGTDLLEALKRELRKRGR